MKDYIYMQRCLELAALGLGAAAPNPMVGSVIVHEGKIIGEGYHHQRGLAHAEVNAVNSVKNQSLLKESTIYVNLEPCAHYGKTPPCANLILEKGIPRIVVGCIDPYAQVAGKGIKMLKDAGREVYIGMLEQESRQLNRRFFTFHEKKRPYIILKWAQTVDGFIDIERKAEDLIEPYWITNHLAKMLVHKWRTQETAFMVGANTALNDNPRLTVRDWHGRNPIRIVADKDLSIPLDLHLFNHEAPTLIFNQLKSGISGNLEYQKICFDEDFPEQILEKLFQHEIQSLVIEGGRKLLEKFIEKNLWDEARIFTGNRSFKKGLKAPNFSGHLVSEQMVGDCTLRLYKN
jgi:diaminohydroxyphosphoribosylaminopyrimidine deaminase / 5-amino-6-(5-phosphoribosylamino)uracil reductase